MNARGSVILLVAVFGPLVLATAGCSPMDKRAQISTRSETPLKARIAHGELTVLDDRWALLPHALGREKTLDGSYSSSFGVVSQSAWSGSWVGFGGKSDQWLNVTVVDLRESGHANVFPRQVALQSWALSFEPDDRRRAESQPAARALRFPEHLLLIARAADDNGDRKIDHLDSARLYSYHLATWQLAPISPVGHNLENVAIVGDRLLMTLSVEPERTRAAVYEHRMADDVGRFHAEQLEP